MAPRGILSSIAPGGRTSAAGALALGLALVTCAADRKPEAAPGPSARPAPSAAPASSAAPAAQGAAGRPPIYLGGHVSEIFNASPPLYANALANAWPWQEPGGGILVEAGKLDDDGNPTVDAFKIGFLHTTDAGPDAVVAGTYRLSFNGQAELRLDEEGSVRNKVYDRATNTTTADVVVPRAGPNYTLHFRDAWRRADHAADATGNARGVTRARLMAPGHAAATDYWFQDAVSLRNAFSLIRLTAALGPGLDRFSHNGSITGVMGSGDTTWSTRARPGFYGYSYKGMPWEDVVLFSNLTGMDVWINIPIGADDDYVTKVFQLLRYGSDGKVPYTTRAHEPEAWTPAARWYPGLAAGRRVYVEFTNELFSYYAYGDPQAKAEIAAGDPHHLNWDGHGGGDRWGMWNAVRISLLARAVWGDAAMQDTIRVVYAGQGDWGSWGRHQYGMDYLAHVWGPSSPWKTIGRFTNPRKPPSYYIHSIAGSFYVHCHGGGTPAATEVGSLGRLGAADGTGLFGELKASLSVPGGLRRGKHDSSVDQRIAWGAAMAARYGVKLSGYEVGLEIFSYGSVPDAWRDPQMRALYRALLERFVKRPDLGVVVQSATVRPANPANALSRSFGAADGFPWPRAGAATPTPAWLGVLDVAAGR